MDEKRVHETRESWLMEAQKMLDQSFFSDCEYDLPEKIRSSCGFPRASAGAIGQCWDKGASADETFEIFICPTQAEPVEVIDTLLHELIHAAVGLKEGHRGMFRKLSLEFGYRGKMKSANAEEGTDLRKTLEVCVGRLGPYPHAKMTKKRKLAKPSKWVRYVSLTMDTFKVIVNTDRVAEFGLPRDPLGQEMELA